MDIKIPWRGIKIGCVVTVALVLLRTAVTIGRALYYRYAWLPYVRQDPWVYVGFAAAAIFILAGIFTPKKAVPIEGTLEPEEIEETKNEEP